MKNLYLLATFCLAFTCLSAQTVQWEMHSYYHDPLNEDKAYAVIQTQDGNYVFAGKYGTNGTGNGDVYIEKVSALGVPIWMKVYGDNLGDEVRSIIELSDGSLVVSGITYQLGGTNTDNSYKILLMKLDANGDSLWTRRYGSSGISVPDGLGNDVAATHDGGLVVIGKYVNSGNDFLILKTDANGDSVWAKLYGGSGSDIPRSIELTSDNGFIVAGSTKSYGPSAGVGNMWLLKLDASGDTTWTKAISVDAFDDCFSVHSTSDGGYILAGSSGSTVTSASLAAVKTDADGEVEWSKKFGNPDINMGRDIVQTADKGYALVGSRVASHGYYLGYPQLLYVVKMDSAGTKQWDKEMGFDNTPNGANGFSIINTSDGGLLAAGYDQPDTASGGTENLRAYLVKFAPLPTKVIEKEKSLSVYAYPNPFSGHTTITLSEKLNMEAALSIYNITGQELLFKNIPTGTVKIQINRNELPAGMYFYSIYYGDRVKLIGKLMAE